MAGNNFITKNYFNAKQVAALFEKMINRLFKLETIEGIQ